MGDSSHTCRGFETPSLGNDLWPMGFDVDLALETPGTRKDHGSHLSSGLVTGGLNSLHSAGNTSTGGGYGDIHQLTGLSSILQRSDELQAGDICQMTDLTNSLPKGDSESAQSLLAKLACHDLGPDLASSVDASHKEIETALFDPNAVSLSHSGGGNGVSGELAHKDSLESADVYGRMTCYGGKLILQLRHFNLNTNYTLNVTECWLCGDKVNSGAELCPHKHSLNGLFQVNDEYVQLEIEHYIIPDHELDAPDNHDMTDNMLQHANTSALHQDMSSTRDLEIHENLSGNGDALGLGSVAGVSMGSTGSTLHYTATPDAGLMPPLSVAPNLMSHAIGSQNPCLNQSFSQLPLPSMSVTNSPNDMNPNIPGIVKNESLSSAAHPLCSSGTPVIGCTASTSVMGGAVTTSLTGLSHSEAVSSATLISPSIQRKLPMQNNQISLVNNYAVDNVLTSFNVDEQINNASIPSQSDLRDITSEDKHALQYHLPFSEGEYTCHTSEGVALPEKQHDDSCLTPLHSVSMNLDSQMQKMTDDIPKRSDIGSKKRKSRVQRKSSTFQDCNTRPESLENVAPKNFMEDSIKKGNKDPMKNDCLRGPSMEYRQVRSEASFVEDWIRQNLDENDLIVTDNQLKVSSNIESRLTSSDQSFESKISESKIPENSPKQKEPDQTSQLAADMLTRGIELICRLCQKDFGKDIRVYKIHMSEHGLKENELFACSFCTKTFSKGKYYTQHLKTHIKHRRFSCQYCPMSYTREAKLRRHLLTHSTEGLKKDFHCPKCSKSFSTKYYLTSHLKSHAGKKFKCDTCGFLCSNSYNLEIHKKRHLPDKLFKCDLCEKTFQRRDFLDNHMENVHKNRKLKCEICCKLFSRKDVLKRHLAVHSNETHECEICAKKFTRKDRLLTHSKSHKSTSTYKCSLCPASFLRKFVLDKHEKIHQTKEQCNICYIFLPSKQRLLNHMKLHSQSNSKEDGEGMQKCEICNKLLTSKDILKKHMRKIHGKFSKTKTKVKPMEREKRFFCQWCSKGFTRSCNLNSHLLKAHSKDTEDEFDDDLSSVLKSKLVGTNVTKALTSRNVTSRTSVSSSSVPLINTSSLQTSVTSANNGAIAVGGGLGSGGTAAISQNTNFPAGGPFTSGLISSSPASTPPHPTPALPVTSHFSSGPPDSPINLSTDAITAAAYLLAYLSYPGPY